MKRIYSIWLIGLASLFYQSLFAYDFEVNGIYYNIISSTDHTVSVTYKGYNSDPYNDARGNLVIPSTVKYLEDSYTVTEIGNSAFFCCYALKSVVIPNSVTTIGSSAFYSCTNITKIVLPNNLETIRYRGFFGCTKLGSITIPKNVKNIDETAFQNSTNIKKVCNLSSLPIKKGDGNYGHVAHYASIVYDNCYVEDNFVMKNEINKRYICDYLGHDSNLYLPKYDGILDYAFYYCPYINKINIPSSVNAIGNYTFAGCSNLESIEVEESNNVYDSRCNCNAIILSSAKELIVGCAKTIIPNDITKIGNTAFAECSKMERIDLPSSLSEIGSQSFSGCIRLNSIVIPKNLSVIGEEAFLNCSNIKKVCNLSSSISIVKSSNSYGFIASNAAVVFNNCVIEDDYVIMSKDGKRYLCDYCGNDSNLNLAFVD